MRARAASLLVVASTGVALTLAACNDDGRTLREPRPDQVDSVSTLAPTTTVAFTDTLPGEPLDPLAIDPFITDPLSTDPLAIDPLSTDAAVIAGQPVDGQVVNRLVGPFDDGGMIGARHTCDGDDLSPPFSWTPSPTGTQEIALTLVDAAAPDAPLWVISGLSPFVTSLPEGSIPEFAVVGGDEQGVAGYRGPCPPAGQTATYVFTVHFLDQVTELTEPIPAADLQAFVKGATFESASVSGTYSRV